jgi:ABC-2 type transport system ATP-binding protein
MEQDRAVIELNALTRHYGKVEAVNGLTLTVRAGRNGAGKTTSIKCLLNLLQPTAGSVRVFGLDPRQEEVAVKSRLS